MREKREAEGRRCQLRKRGQGDSGGKEMSITEAGARGKKAGARGKRRARGKKAGAKGKREAKGRRRLISEAEGEVLIGVDAAVTEEGPPATHLLGTLEVDVHEEVLGFCLRGLGKDFALGTCHKAGSPELDATRLTAGIGLVPYPIHGNDRKSVGHGMTALHELPCLTLTCLLLWGVAALEADGCRID